MILLIGVILGIFVAWQVRHNGLYLALCDALGITFGGAAALSYVGKVAEIVPIDHHLKGAACMLVVFVLVWLMFRTLARSFAGDYAVEFGKQVDLFGGMVVALGGTMMFVAVIATVFLCTGPLLEKISTFESDLRNTAELAVSACKFIAWFAGEAHAISLDGVVKIAAST